MIGLAYKHSHTSYNMTKREKRRWQQRQQKNVIAPTTLCDTSSVMRELMSNTHSILRFFFNIFSLSQCLISGAFFSVLLFIKNRKKYLEICMHKNKKCYTHHLITMVYHEMVIFSECAHDSLAFYTYSLQFLFSNFFFKKQKLSIVFPSNFHSTCFAKHLFPIRQMTIKNRLQRTATNLKEKRAL